LFIAFCKGCEYAWVQAGKMNCSFVYTDFPF